MYSYVSLPEGSALTMWLSMKELCHGTGGNGFPGHLLGIRQAQQDVLADAAGEEDWLLEGFFDARERCQIPPKEWF